MRMSQDHCWWRRMFRPNMDNGIGIALLENNLYNIVTQNYRKKVLKVDEDMAVFKGYLRSLMRQLKLLKKTLDDNNIEEAKKLIDELIEDTQNNIED